MNIEQEKTEAQERIAQELPEEVRPLPETEELSDSELEGVNGGYKMAILPPTIKKAQDGTEAVAGGAITSKDVAATKLNVFSRDCIRQMMQNRK